MRFLVIVFILIIAVAVSVAKVTKPSDYISEASETESFTWIKIASLGAHRPTTYRLVDTEHDVVCYYTDHGTTGAISCLPLERESDKQ